MTELERLAAALDASAAGGGVPVLATLAAIVTGSSYRDAGARMVVHPDDTSTGAISGGCLEKDVAAHAAAVRASREPARVAYDLTRDDDAPWGLAMGCAARLSVLLEPCPGGAPAWLREVLERHGRREAVVVAVGEHTRLAAERDGAAGEAWRSRASCLRDDTLFQYLAPPIAVVACGEGPDVAPLLALTGQLGWLARGVGRDDPLGELDARTAAVVMTHNYPRDLALLETLLCSAARYVGLLGPRGRTERLLGDLAARGVHPQPAQLQRLSAPVGLDIGAESPDEIALAILAEIRAVFSGRGGGRLRERGGPIHER